MDIDKMQEIVDDINEKFKDEIRPGCIPKKLCHEINQFVAMKYNEFFVSAEFENKSIVFHLD
ncbi:hypothetical protein PP935_gp035 [Rhizobium phage RHph_N34]|uniref:Uncharacterized protein n=1 Tax=Rhizobium phage RHph_N34 TaxID=2509586 RepID=A0A7S5RFA6_9CAUD|nr:hypothetical protein PP935_gp035 [Rhizobium phage RHph_N34]QIG73810.1 hypothetical protein EVC06_035 [Rhizobium phage RHph_N34]